MTTTSEATNEKQLAALEQEFMSDAAFDETYVVLTIGSSLIATFGLLADSTAVVIGAMVIAPWILPLKAMAFEIIRGRIGLLLRSFRTLFLGVLISVILSFGIGKLVSLPSFGSEVFNRTSPTLLDLGIALVAGSIASYAQLRRDAISALAGLAIAVALVPPVCVFGLLLSDNYWQQAYGAGLLFATNLLGILVGAMTVMGILEPSYRRKLIASRLGITSLILTALLVIPLGGSFFNLVERSRQEVAREKVAQDIRRSLANETITLGRDSELVSVRIDWTTNPPVVRAQVRVTNQFLPTSAQVADVQKFINARQAPYRFRLVVQRSAIDVIGPETEPNPPEAFIVPPPPLPPLKQAEPAEEESENLESMQPQNEEIREETSQD